MYVEAVFPILQLIRLQRDRDLTPFAANLLLYCYNTFRFKVTDPALAALKCSWASQIDVHVTYISQSDTEYKINKSCDWLILVTCISIWDAHKQF